MFGNDGESFSSTSLMVMEPPVVVSFSLSEPEVSPEISAASLAPLMLMVMVWFVPSDA